MRVWERERKRMLRCNSADRGCVAHWDNITSPETEQTFRRCSHSRSFMEPTKEAMQMTTAHAVGAASHTSGGFFHRRAHRL
jgi:hypothetical protein